MLCMHREGNGFRADTLAAYQQGKPANDSSCPSAACLPYARCCCAKAQTQREHSSMQYTGRFIAHTASIIQHSSAIYLCASNASHHLLGKLVTWWLAVGRLVLLILAHSEERSSTYTGDECYHNDDQTLQAQVAAAYPAERLQKRLAATQYLPPTASWLNLAWLSSSELLPLYTSLYASSWLSPPTIHVEIDTTAKRIFVQTDGLAASIYMQAIKGSQQTYPSRKPYWQVVVGYTQAVDGSCLGKCAVEGSANVNEARPVPAGSLSELKP